ncbi:MAG: ABC transporter ATP-binding protein [Ectothiorhodospiraceae bacterium]|nr:ABC transporter ATP-binding protein [Chromatiales bacterium]MCP5155700.1 ABC transporter ATP-binding protein [Ectothiorhodospiraceae bacterium]
MTDVVAGYGDSLILRGVSLAVESREIVTLLGANGSGKSTILNTISGFVRPREGAIEIAGASIGGLPPHRTFRHGVVQVSQARDLFGDLSVSENLKLGCIVHGDESAGLARVYDYFPRLAERRSQRVSTMSGGEQQMVALGRALMSQPRLLLLDEPSGGLSPRFVEEIGEIAKRMRADGLTILLVEQNLRLALAVSDRYLILRDGKVVDGGDAASMQGSHEDIVRRIYL